MVEDSKQDEKKWNNFIGFKFLHVILNQLKIGGRNYEYNCQFLIGGTASDVIMLKDHRCAIVCQYQRIRYWVCASLRVDSARGNIQPPETRKQRRLTFNLLF